MTQLQNKVKQSKEVLLCYPACQKLLILHPQERNTLVCTVDSEESRTKAQKRAQTVKKERKKYTFTAMSSFSYLSVKGVGSLQNPAISRMSPWVCI